MPVFIHRKKSTPLELTKSQQKSAGSLASAAFKKHGARIRIAALGKSAELAALGVPKKVVDEFTQWATKQLTDSYVAGAQAANSADQKRIGTANAQRAKDRDERYKKIRNVFKKHLKKPRTDAVRLTASATGASEATVRRATTDLRK